MGGAGHFCHPQRRPAKEILRPGNVPVPVRAHPYGTRAQLRHGGRGCALQARHGIQRAPSHGLGRLRHAGGERRHGAQGSSQSVDLSEHRGHEGAAQVHGAFAGLAARDRNLRSRLLQAPAENVPRFSARGAGRTQARQSELGSGRSDGACQRAGDRRAWLALGCSCGPARDAAVVFCHYPVLPGSPGRTRPAGALAREGAHDAAQLDRPL